MHFVNRLRRAQRVALGTLLHPIVVVPLIIEIPDYRRGARRLLVQQAERIGLVDSISMLPGFDVEFVECTAFGAGNKTLPDPGRAPWAEAMRLGIPAVEAADHRHRSRIRRPHAEDGAGLALVRGEVRAHLVVNAVIAALVEEVEILVGEKLRGSEGGILAHKGATLGARLSVPESAVRRKTWLHEDSAMEAPHRKSFFRDCTKNATPSNKVVIVISASNTTEAAGLHAILEPHIPRAIPGMWATAYPIPLTARFPTIMVATVQP